MYKKLIIIYITKLQLKLHPQYWFVWYDLSVKKKCIVYWPVAWKKKTLRNC